jgi:hypothetical protein
MPLERQHCRTFATVRNQERKQAKLPVMVSRVLGVTPVNMHVGARRRRAASLTVWLTNTCSHQTAASIRSLTSVTNRDGIC